MSAGVVGRFVAGDPRQSEFIQYGEFGVPLRNSAATQKLNEKSGPDRWGQITRDEKVGLAVDGYRTAASKYGKYFHG